MGKIVITELLYRDAADIYERARREVTIPRKDGSRQKYAANRYKRQIDKAHADHQLVSAIGRIVSRPTQGFGHLEDAGRDDLMVETMETGGRPDFGVCAAVDVHYLSTGGARAAAVLAADAAFAHVLAERTAVVPRVPPYRPGEFYLRELPPLHAVLDNLSGLGLLVVDGYADLDPTGRPGLGAHAHAQFGVPVIGVAKSTFRTATHAVPVVRGSSGRPLFVTAAGMPAADAADLVRRMAGRYRLPDALRRADTLARAGPPAAIMTDRQLD